MELNRENRLLWGLGHSDVKILRHLKAKQDDIPGIAATTGIPRTSLYYMLKKLSSRGLVSSVKMEKKIYWQAASDTMIHKRYVAGLDVHAPENNVIRYDISQDTSLQICFGIKNVLGVWEQIAALPKNSRILGIQPERSLIMAVTRNRLDDIVLFNEKIREKGIIVEGIIHRRGTDSMYKVLSKSDGLRLLKSFANRSADTSELPDNLLGDTEAEMYIYEKKVAIVNWHREFCVIIENKDVSELARTLFASTKYLLNRYDQNERVARRLIDLKSQKESLA